VLDIPFLRDLPREQFDLLSPLFEPFTVQSRTVIFKQGDEANYLYLILEGRVAILYKPHDGPRITLTHLHDGDFFGWSAVVGTGAYTSDAETTTELKSLRIRGSDLRQLYLKNPNVGRSVLEKLADAVSPRWMNAKRQVRTMLQNKAFQQGNNQNQTD